VTLRWAEQYYLNAGYQVYVNGALWGYTPNASFTLPGLDPSTDYTVEVRSLWQDGIESPSDARRGARISFNLKSMAAAQSE